MLATRSAVPAGCLAADKAASVFGRARNDVDVEKPLVSVDDLPSRRSFWNRYRKTLIVIATTISLLAAINLLLLYQIALSSSYQETADALAKYNGSTSTCTAETERHAPQNRHHRTRAAIVASREDWQRWLEATLPDAEAVQSSFLSASHHLKVHGLPEIHTGRRGIVINSRGDARDVHLLRFTLASLRRVGCYLPVEVWMFRDEASSASVAEIETMSMANQTVVVRFGDDERLFAPVTKEKGDLEGYHLKFAAALNSGFEEILMMDSDVMALKNPEELFETEGYKETGTLFWPDYWKTSAKNPAWEWTDTPCRDEWEQESGMLLLHKRRTWRPLLLAHYLNRSLAARRFHAFLFGDKDLFRFSWHAVRQPFNMVQHHLLPAGFVLPPQPAWWQSVTNFLAGKSRQNSAPSPPRICSKAMMQRAPDGRPFFLHVNLIKHLKKPITSVDALVTVVQRYKSNVDERKREYRGRYFSNAGVDGCVDYEDDRGETELVSVDDVAGEGVSEWITREMVRGLPALKGYYS
ncbi:hypothetical protein HDU96_009406 [Phlyctochytrium bullatum]|nr:hypothetical protein HDU96_009406 [Phlyctochytrium bullatum]